MDPDNENEEALDMDNTQNEQSQSQRKKKFKLINGVKMKVTGCGPIDQTGDIKLKMEWTVPSRNILNREIVIPWDDSSSKKAKDFVWRKLGGPVFLDSSNQVRDFPLFLEREIFFYEEDKMNSGNFMSAKPIKEFDSVSLLDVEVGPDHWDLYMIAGKDIIFLLGPNSGDEWAHELTEEELQDFPYDIVWSGGETKFEANSKKATELIFKIVGNINQAQEPDNYSFSLFSICNSIAGYLYLPKMKRVGNVMTYMTISGEGFSTGKSLCTDICMITLYGERLDCTAPTTIPKLYEMLASGTPIFVREWTEELWKILKVAAPAVWEANGRSGKIPKTTMFLSANLTTAEVEKRLTPAVRSKLTLIHSGESSLSSEHITELCTGALQASRDLYPFLPSVVGLGALTMLKKATSQEIAAYNGELRKENDEREGQVLADYDRFYKMLKEKALECNLELPPLFRLDFIDHGALTRQNRNEEVIKDHLNTVLDFLERTGLFDVLVPASRDSEGQGYKVNASDPRLPADIKAALSKCSETFCTTVAHKSVRLRFINCSKLDPNVAQQLEHKVFEANQNYEAWTEKAIDQMMKESRIHGRLFVSSFPGVGTRGHEDPVTSTAEDDDYFSELSDTEFWLAPKKSKTKKARAKQTRSKEASSGQILDRDINSNIEEENSRGGQRIGVPMSGGMKRGGQARRGQIRVGQVRGGQMRGEPSGSLSSGGKQPVSKQSGSGQSGSGQSGSGQSGSGQSGSGQSRSGEVESFICQVKGCPSENHIFARNRYYTIHLKTDSHQQAMLRVAVNDEVVNDEVVPLHKRQKT